MAATQQVMAPSGPRPTPPQAPPPQPGMVLPHTHNPQPHLVPVQMMQNPNAAAQFAQGANFPHQIPLQHHNQRPIMNGIPPSTHQNFPALQNTPSQIAAARQAQLRQLQNSGIPPGAMAQLQYQPQMPPAIHSQQLHPMQHYQQQQQATNPGLRLPQHQIIGSQPLVPQVIPGPGIQQIPGPQGPQPMVPARSHSPLHRFSQFAFQLGALNLAKTRESFWQDFVREWFVQNAAIRLVLGEDQQGGKEFEVPYLLIPHFFLCIHTSGIRQMHVILGTPQPEAGHHLIDCPRASILYRFENGSQLIWDGPLKVLFKMDRQELRIEKLEIVKDEFIELIPRKTAELTLTPPLSNRSTSPDAKRSPMMLGQMANDVRGGSDQEEEKSIPLPESDINGIGVPTNIMGFLEVAEVCVYIQPLIEYSRAKEISPRHALQMFPMNHPVKQFQQPNSFPYIPQSNQLASPMNEMSPMVPHATIPVPGLTSSPQPHHQSSPMSSQTSQTGASGANTTPLLSNRQAPSSAPSKMQTNKRRRGSGVATMSMKEEDEEAIGNPPHTKHPKQSPRIGIGGRGGGPGGPIGKRIRGDS